MMRCTSASFSSSSSARSAMLMQSASSSHQLMPRHSAPFRDGASPPRVGPAELRVFFDRALEPRHRLLGIFARHPAETLVLQTPKQAVVRIEIVWPFAARHRGVTRLDPTDDGGDDACR
jgi:hypothetical protein